MILKNCSLKQFKRTMQNKNIVCFGAGNYLREFIRQCDIKNRIRFIIDNNEKLWDTFINIDGQNIKILSLENAIKQINSDDILLITTYLETGIELYNILENNMFFEDYIVYWAFFLIKSNENIKESICKNNLKFKFTEEIKIPKIIHYCWFGKSPIPEEFQKYIAGWKEKCPDFEIVKWNESNYDISKNIFMKQAYDAKAWGFVPDYARKDIIYEYGGIYLDTDVEVIKNLEDLLYQDGFCGFENFEKINFGLGFGAKKHLPIIKDLRDMYNNMEFNLNKRDMITGPICETMGLKKYGLKTDGNYQSIDEFTIYPIDVLSGANLYTDEKLITQNTYTIHHYAGSWLEKNFQRAKNKAKIIYQNKKRESFL